MVPEGIRTGVRGGLQNRTASLASLVCPIRTAFRHLPTTAFCHVVTLTSPALFSRVQSLCNSVNRFTHSAHIKGMFRIVLLICIHSDDDVPPSSTVNAHSQQGATGIYPAVPDLTPRPRTVNGRSSRPGDQFTLRSYQYGKWRKIQPFPRDGRCSHVSPQEGRHQLPQRPAHFR